MADQGEGETVTLREHFDESMLALRREVAACRRELAADVDLVRNDVSDLRDEIRQVRERPVVTWAALGTIATLAVAIAALVLNLVLT